MFLRQLPRLPVIPGLEHLNKLGLSALLPELVSADGRLGPEERGAQAATRSARRRACGLGCAVQDGLCALALWDAAYGTLLTSHYMFLAGSFVQELLPRASKGVCTAAQAANSKV
jgi:hypothetical protein